MIEQIDSLSEIQDLRYVLEALSFDILHHFYEPSMSGLPSPKWVVECRNCSATVVHSEVGPDRAAEDYLRPTARKFSVLGEELECPKCKTKAKYTREDLRYRQS